VTVTVEMHLRDMGAEVTLAHDGAEALEQSESATSRSR
jgi:CheY-like chemotaxis protein